MFVSHGSQDDVNVSGEMREEQTLSSYVNQNELFRVCSVGKLNEMPT